MGVYMAMLKSWIVEAAGPLNNINSFGIEIKYKWTINELTMEKEMDRVKPQSWELSFKFIGIWMDKVVGKDHEFIPSLDISDVKIQCKEHFKYWE